jgi:tetratricopeptide (TPR) repeat protein
MRGEEPRARALEDATQVLFIQLGNAWVFESHRAWTSSIAYGSIDDVLGLKNSMEELERLIATGYSLQGFARLAQGEYLRARGDTEAARAVLEDALPRVPADHVLLRQITAAALVETLVADDAWDQAAVVASEVLAALPDVEDGLYAGHLRLARGRALAWAGQGDLQRAGAELDRLLADDTPQLRPLLSPLLKGLLHEARAWVAQRADDHGGYLWHATEGERHFASTENSVLLARGRRLLSAIPPLAEAGAIDTAAADSQTAPLVITSGDSQTDHDSVTVVEHPDVD